MAATTINGLKDLNPNKVGQVDNYFTFTEQLRQAVRALARRGPEREDAWQGILLQGGFSTGRTVTDNCDLLAQLPEGETTRPAVLPSDGPVSHAGKGLRGLHRAARSTCRSSGTLQCIRAR